MEESLMATEVAVCTDAVKRVELKCMEEVEATADGPGWHIISALPKDLWTKLRAIVKQALKQMIIEIGTDLDGFGYESCNRFSCKHDSCAPFSGGPCGHLGGGLRCNHVCSRPAWDLMGHACVHAHILIMGLRIWSTSTTVYIVKIQAQIRA
jgi:hypothetical protein